MTLVGEGVDEVRRLERAAQPALASTRYMWLRSPESLSGSQFERFVRLSQMNLRTAKAYHMRLNVQEAWRQRSARGRRASSCASSADGSRAPRDPPGARRAAGS